MFLLNDKPLPLDTPFEHDGIQYPANWLRLSTADEKAAIGITEVPDPAPYDDRFYWGVGQPKDLDMVKSMLVAQIKATAGSMLAPTDWKVVRAAEGIKPVDADTLTYRASVRAASNQNEDAVMAATTVNELTVIQFLWPVEDSRGD